MSRHNLDLSQTIFSLITGSLPCAVAIVRLSGPSSFSIAQTLFRPETDRDPSTGRGMRFGQLRDRNGAIFDSALLLSFVSPNSFTGEDIIEFQLHGSIPIVRRLEGELLALGARPAERGEFTYRALLNGKLAPSEVEVLGDIFLARQVVDLKRIYARKDGAIETQIQILRDRLLKLQAILDTAVDFSEEYSSVVAHAHSPLEEVSHECSRIIRRYETFRTQERSPRIVLAGRPNAGKSSLFNALLCRYRAIVHETPGTTRDVIEEEVEIEGRSWKLVDTAGIRSAQSPAEEEGISLGADYLSSCAFWLLVVDGTQGIGEQENSLLDGFGEKPHLVVWNKADLVDYRMGYRELEILNSSHSLVVEVSAKTGEALSLLWERLRESLAAVNPEGAEALPSAVQVARLRAVTEELCALKVDLSGGVVPPEYLAERNRSIVGRLEAIIGEISTEDVLDRVFGEFCIGK